MKIKAKSKVGLYILILTLIIAFEGCIQEKITNISKETPIVENTPISGQKIAKIIDYKITGDSSGSYIFVNISFKKLPITVYLFDEFGGIVDSKTVKKHLRIIHQVNGQPPVGLRIISLRMLFWRNNIFLFFPS